MRESEGGKDENSFVRCWKFDDWYAGSIVDIRDKWDDEHRMWILCCEKEEDAGGDENTR